MNVLIPNNFKIKYNPNTQKTIPVTFKHNTERDMFECKTDKQNSNLQAPQSIFSVLRENISQKSQKVFQFIEQKFERQSAIRKLSKELNKNFGHDLRIKKYSDSVYRDIVTVCDEDSIDDINAKTQMFKFLSTKIQDKDVQTTADILNVTNSQTLPFVIELIEDKDFSNMYIGTIFENKTPKDTKAIKKMYDFIKNDKTLGECNRCSIITPVNAYNFELVKALYEDKNYHNSSIYRATSDLDFIPEVVENKIKLLKPLNNLNILSCKKGEILHKINKYNHKVIEALLNDNPKQINLNETISKYDTKGDTDSKIEVFNVFKETIIKEDLYKILSGVNEQNKNDAMKYCQIYDPKFFDGEEISYILRHKNVNADGIVFLSKNMKKKDFKNLYPSSKVYCSRLVSLFKKRNLNGLSAEELNNILHSMLTQEEMIIQNTQVKKYFPLIPYSQEEYCKLFPKVVKALNKLNSSFYSDKKFHIDSSDITENFTKNKDFNNLNLSDKKVLLLCSILLALPTFQNKSENNSKVFQIANEYELNDDEKYKLFTLYKTRDWIKQIEKSNNQDKRLQSFSYDFRFDNLADMALILAKAQGPDCEKYRKELFKNVNTLKKSQPILPVTKLPKASTVKEAVTKINNDGSTNIKGVYINKKGLVMLKFNEIEDWVKIGFPKGSKSKGIKTFNIYKLPYINTGNIKFFVHGVDKPKDTVKFDAFNLMDSDALLSVSYTERPESKYRFFRTQGLILDVDTRDIHGGGYTDAGSGTKKTIDKFKNSCIFGGSTEEENRIFISNLIKKTTGMSDNKYIEFVKKNRNKPFQEIEPAEYQEKIIKKLAKINSDVRIGNREYNEIYISNPKVIGVFAYPANEEDKTSNPIKMMNNLKELKLAYFEKYAIERDIPMVVFGK